MGLFDFFANRSEQTFRQTGPNYEEKIRVGPFGERKEERKGEYIEVNLKRTDKNLSQTPQGLFGIFSSKSEPPRIDGNQGQRQLKPKK